MFTDFLAQTRLGVENPVFTTLSDKYSAKLSLRGHELIKTAELYQVTDRPEEIDFGLLPDQFSVKPNHLSGTYLIIKRGSCSGVRGREAGGTVCGSWSEYAAREREYFFRASDAGGTMWSGHGRVELPYDEETVKRCCRQWLARRHGREEIYYHSISPRIVIEELLDVVLHLRFFVFHGRVGLISTPHHSRGSPCTNWYTPTWQRLDVGMSKPPYPRPVPPPDRLEEYIATVESLTGPLRLNFVRFDSYLAMESQGSIGFYFGEYTITPGACRHPFVPTRFDDLLYQWLVRGRVDLKQLSGFLSTDPSTPDGARKRRLKTKKGGKKNRQMGRKNKIINSKKGRSRA
jgi:hypothetical protein